MLLKVLTGLLGLTAQPKKMSSAAHQQECKFVKASLKKGGGAFFGKEGCLFGMHGGILVKARDFSCNKGEKLQ